MAEKPQRALYRARNPARALAIGDLRVVALRNLPQVNAEYLEGGAENKRTLAGNRSAFDAFAFAPRVLRNVTQVDTSRMNLGKPSRLPFAVAPAGFNGLLRPRGNVAWARATARADIPFGRSTVSNAPLAEIAGAGAQRHWFQLYLYGPDGVWTRMIETARDAGCEAVLVTVDTPVLGNREWDRRNYRSGFTPSWRSRADMRLHPGWMWRVLRHGLPNFSNLVPFIPGPDKGPYRFAVWSLANQRPDVDWATIVKIRKAWSGKLLINGVQHIDDVRAAIAHGLNGVVLSNYGGRQLDRAVAPIRLVRPARAVAGPHFTILVDRGFRRGTEIVQALAFGADAVLVDRAVLYGLAATGEAGATRAIKILAGEISRTLALLGATSLADLSPAIFETDGGSLAA